MLACLPLSRMYCKSCFELHCFALWWWLTLSLFGSQLYVVSLVHFNVWLLHFFVCLLFDAFFFVCFTTNEQKWEKCKKKFLFLFLKVSRKMRRSKVISQKGVGACLASKSHLFVCLFVAFGWLIVGFFCLFVWRNFSLFVSMNMMRSKIISWEAVGACLGSKSRFIGFLLQCWKMGLQQNLPTKYISGRIRHLLVPGIF